jgi:hypothetical protein
VETKVNVNVPPDLMEAAARTIGKAGVTAGRIVEAAFKLVQGEPRDQVIEDTSPTMNRLKNGGQLRVNMDAKWLEGLGNLSQANRVGLLMLIHDISKEEAEVMEAAMPLKGAKRVD